MSYDLVQAVKDDNYYVEWADLVSEFGGHKLKISVMRDALRFHHVPAMTWDRKIIPGDDRIINGVRLGATAEEMQRIADLFDAMLMTAKVVDLVWHTAKSWGTQFDSVINIRGKIVAVSNILDVHDAVEAALAKANGDGGGFIESVGKYWILCNALQWGRFGKRTAANYGWPTRGRGNGPGVTGTVNMWQRIGTRHDVVHQDPSQVVRLMRRKAKLLRAGSTEWVDVDLHDILSDKVLSHLVSHEGVLKVLRLPTVPLPLAA